MVNIYLDPGHGGTDPGAVGNGLQEKALTLSIALNARDYLLDNYEGVSVRMSRTTDKTMSLAARTNDANKWGADSLVSVHINAASASASGYEDFIFNGPVSQTTHNLQDAIHAEMRKVFKDFPNRGQKRANFHMLRESRASAVLPEFLFITNKNDAAFLKKSSNLKKIGKHMAIALAKHHKLKAKEKKKEAPKSSGNMYYVQLGAFSIKNYADSMVKDAKKKGFKDAYAKYEDGFYKVQIGAFSNKKNADNLAAEAKKKGFSVHIAR